MWRIPHLQQVVMDWDLSPGEVLFLSLSLHWDSLVHCIQRKSFLGRGISVGLINPNPAMEQGGLENTGINSYVTGVSGMQTVNK